MKTFLRTLLLLWSLVTVSQISAAPITEQPEGKHVNFSLSAKRGFQMVMSTCIPSNPRNRYQQCVETEEGTFYMKDPMPGIVLNSWIKGTKNNDGSITFEFPQFLGTKSNMFTGKTDYYIRACREILDDNGKVTTMRSHPIQKWTLIRNAAGEYEPADETISLGLTNEDGSIWEGYGMSEYKYSPIPDLISLPEDAAVKDYVLLHEDRNFRGDGSKVKVAVKGNDVYIGGFQNLDNMWIKGTISGKLGKMKMTMTCCQPMGIDLSTQSIVMSHVGSYFEDIIDGQDVQGVRAMESISFDVSGLIDKTFTVTADTLGFWYENRGFISFGNPIILPQDHSSVILDTPMNPIWNNVTEWNEPNSLRQLNFFLPIRNAANNKLLDSKSLFYNIYIDDSKIPYEYDPDKYSLEISEPMTDIPWDFTTAASQSPDFMTSKTHHIIILREKDIKRVGIQSICRVDGQEKRSDIVYFDVIGTGIEGTLAQSGEVVRIEYVDLMGRQVNDPVPGNVYIRRQILSDSSVIVDKIIP